MIENLTIIGVGLIGGSLARALRAANAVQNITGFGRTISHLQQALELNVIDRVASSIKDAVTDADVVVLAVPVETVADFLSQLADVLPDKTIVTDVGSVKNNIQEAARKNLGVHFSRFVPGHPIAGTEKSGVVNSFPELFEQHQVILTPEADTDTNAVSVIQNMWQKTGAQVVLMNSAKHDQILAASSHLPHVLAYALVENLVRRDDYEEIFNFAAGGFHDFTRIASSDPEMWRDICLANRDAILEGLHGFQKDLKKIRDAIKNSDGDALSEIFSRAKHARDALITKQNK
ncbi:MAG: hypothetical protein BMS9Abin11_1166 [Gammaproteobacteria bacterium]|nr:MAG: hypothetical protein BMS9Abin11_1166 [Gammaproteobacteria bacterium]